MSGSIIDSSLALLRRSLPTSVGATGLILGPAAIATSVIDVLSTSADAIVNGSIVMRAHPWTEVELAAGVSGVRVRATVSLLLALAWFVALGVNVRLLAGQPLRHAWPPRSRVLSWLGLGVILTMLAVVGVYFSLVLGTAAGELGDLVTVLAGLVLGFGLARAAIALPALLVDGHDLTGSLRQAVATTRGQTLPIGTALLSVAGVAPVALLGVTSGRLVPTSDSWTGDVLWAGTSWLLTYLVLVLAVPVQAAILLGAYRSVAADVTPCAKPPAGSHGMRPRPRRLLGVVGMVLLLAVPALARPALVLANPRGLPILTVARPDAGFSSRPLAVTVLADGTVATVDDMQVALCADAHCTHIEFVGMPCVDGSQPQPVGESGRSCGIEAPLAAADITSDGTMLALRRGPRNQARLIWCGVDRVDPNGQCRWGGAIDLFQQPDLWENWSMDVVSVVGGGFAAAIIGPGKDARSGRLSLIGCDRLNCPNPTVRAVRGVPLPGGWQGGGVVAIAADPQTGNLALGYLDRADGSLWLGGCRAGCSDIPELTRIGAWPAYADEQAPVLPSLRVVATATGPAAVLGGTSQGNGAEFGVPRAAAVVLCGDLSCTKSANVWPGGFTTATLATDRTGTVYLIGDDPAGTRIIRGPGSNDSSSTVVPATGNVVAAAFGPDGRLRLVLDDTEGRALVTLAYRVDHQVAVAAVVKPSDSYSGLPSRDAVSVTGRAAR